MYHTIGRRSACIGPSQDESVCHHTWIQKFNIREEGEDNAHKIATIQGAPTRNKIPHNAARDKSGAKTADSSAPAPASAVLVIVKGVKKEKSFWNILLTACTGL